MEQHAEKFDLWCIVELFSHTRIAGKCTEQNIAGTNMLRIDVPETKQNVSFTRFFGSAAIYAINPVTEDVATDYADRLNVKPIESWDFSKMMEKHNKLLLERKATPAGQLDEDDDDREDFRN